MAQSFSVADGRDAGGRRAAFRLRPDGQADPAGEAGWYLQYERERRGESLADAAVETHIKATYLHALELGALDKLPGWPYVLGIVASYAKFLGLEPDPLVRHYRSFVHKPTLREQLGRQRNWDGRGVLDAAAVAAAFLLGLGLFAFIDPDRFTSSGVRMAAPTGAVTPAPTTGPPAGNGLDLAIAPSPEMTGSVGNTSVLDAALPTVRVRRSPIEGETKAPVPRPSPARLQRESELESRVANGDAGLQGESGMSLTDLISGTLAKRPDESAAGETQNNSSPDTTSVEEAAAPGKPVQVVSTDSPPSRISLRALGNVWVRIEDKGGNVILHQVLAEGEIYKVPDRDDLLLIVRDAGALEAMVDGKSVGSLGEPGGIIVSQPLTPGEMRKLGAASQG